jgi:hypothetical protein
MQNKTLKQAAKKYNAQIKKEIKILQSGVTEGKNKNEWLKKQIKKQSIIL